MQTHYRKSKGRHRKNQNTLGRAVMVEGTVEAGLQADAEVEFWLDYLEQLTPRGLVNLLMTTRQSMAALPGEENIGPTKAVVRWYLERECRLDR
jgi:hypothetical protein